MMAMEGSDILFCTPAPLLRSRATLPRSNRIWSTSSHGHNPILSEMIVKAADDPQLKERAAGRAAKGINIVRCAAPEMNSHAARHPDGGDALDQELAIATGAVEAMVVDYQHIPIDRNRPPPATTPGS